MDNDLGAPPPFINAGELLHGAHKMTAKQKNYTSKGDGTENCATNRFVAEPAAHTVADYARQRMHITLDINLPTVPLDNVLGELCKNLIDAASELQRCSALFCGAPPEITHALRAIAHQLLTNALNPNQRPNDIDLHRPY